MTVVIAFIVANKALVASLGVAVLSEIMPMLPTRANGIAHALVLILKSMAPEKPEADK